MSQVYKTQFPACLLSYNERIVQILQASKTRFFACLLTFLAGLPYFYLVIVALIGLIIGLAFGKIESIGGKVAIGFFGYSL